MKAANLWQKRGAPGWRRASRRAEEVNAVASEAEEKLLEGWMHAYGTAVKRLCLMVLKDYQEAEDAMQDTFLKAWRSMAGGHSAFAGRNGASEKTWMMRIAINVCRDYQRRRWFRHVDMRKALDELPESSVAVEPEDRALMLEIAALPDKYKQPLLLHYWQHMTLEETAEALETTMSTVYNRLKKAQELLRTKLDLEGGERYAEQNSASH